MTVIFASAISVQNALVLHVPGAAARTGEMAGDLTFALAEAAAAQTVQS